jgi:hypothetical protein
MTDRRDGLAWNIASATISRISIRGVPARIRESSLINSSRLVTGIHMNPGRVAGENTNDNPPFHALTRSSLPMPASSFDPRAFSSTAGLYALRSPPCPVASRCARTGAMASSDASVIGSSTS